MAKFKITRKDITIVEAEDEDEAMRMFEANEIDGYFETDAMIEIEEEK